MCIKYSIIQHTHILCFDVTAFIGTKFHVSFYNYCSGMIYIRYLKYYLRYLLKINSVNWLAIAL